MQKVIKWFFILLGVSIVVAVLGYATLFWSRVPRKIIHPISWSFPQKDNLKFLIVGDIGTGKEAEYKVAAAMEKRCVEINPDAVIFLGDNHQGKGFKSVNDKAWDKRIFGPFDHKCLNTKMKYAILGNHDYKKNPFSEIEMTGQKGKWMMPHRFYSVKYGDLLQIAAIDSNIPDICGDSEKCAIDFLNKSLKNSNAKWNIVMGHHPLTASASLKRHLIRLPRRMMYKFLVQPALCDRADAYLSGHMHFLEHRDIAGCQADQFIAGGGGAHLYKLDAAPSSASYFSKMSHGFLELDVTEQKLVWKFFDDENNLLYETEEMKKEDASPDSESKV